jgi:hypothetical protein
VCIVDVNALTSTYHLPFDGAMVETKEAAFDEFESNCKLPSVVTGNVDTVENPLIGFNVAKLFVGVSVVTSVAARLVEVK